jgi:hypothetical protein
MPRALLNLQLYGNAWAVHFIHDDCRTRIGSRTRYFKFATLDSLRSFVTRCQPEDATLAGSSIASSGGGGSEYLHRSSTESCAAGTGYALQTRSSLLWSTSRTPSARKSRGWPSRTLRSDWNALLFPKCLASFPSQRDTGSMRSNQGMRTSWKKAASDHWKRSCCGFSQKTVHSLFYPTCMDGSPFFSRSSQGWMTRRQIGMHSTCLQRGCASSEKRVLAQGVNREWRLLLERTAALRLSYRSRSVPGAGFAALWLPQCKTTLPVASLSDTSQGMAYRSWHALQTELDSGEILYGVCGQPPIRSETRWWLFRSIQILPAILLAVTNRRLIAISMGAGDTDGLYETTVRYAPIRYLEMATVEDTANGWMVSLKLGNDLAWRFPFETGQHTMAEGFVDLLEHFASSSAGELPFPNGGPSGSRRTGYEL